MFLKDSNNFNVATANTLTTARTLTIGNTGKSFNGSGNVSWSLSEIGAAASSHTHSYLPLSGGTLTGNVAFNNNMQLRFKTATDLVNKNSTTIAAGTVINTMFTYNSSHNLHIGSGIYDNGIITGSTFLTGATGIYLRSVTADGACRFSFNGITKATIDGDGTIAATKFSGNKAVLTTTGSSWVSGKTITNASICVNTQQTTGSYHPVLAVKSASNHVVNLGGINNEFGFYGFQSSRTENGTDWSFKFDAGNGNITHTSTLTTNKLAIGAGGSSAVLEKWYTGGKTARIDYYQNPNRLELFWSATNNGSDWTWANTIYFDENGTVKAKVFNINGAKVSNENQNNILFVRNDGAEYSQITCRSLNIGAYSGVTKKLSIESSAPSSPKTGDVWIQV